MNATVHDTIRLTEHVDAPAAEVWEAFVDPSKRTLWGVPSGDVMIYDEFNFLEGGRDRHRYGPPGDVNFHTETEYTRIVPHELVVYTETVSVEGRPLATALVSWEFHSDQGGTGIMVTSQVVSFVGIGMIDGSRNGHTKVLAQLGRFLA